MADSFIGVAEGSDKKLQTNLNTVGGVAVHSEAVTPTDASGNAFNSGNPFPVTGPLTDTQLRASAVPVSGSVDVIQKPSATSTATSIFRNVAITNTAVSIKASSGRLISGHFFNPGVALAYLHFYDVASGSVTVGTTVPTYSIPLPSTATSSIADDWAPSIPIPFGTAITVAASTTPNGGSAPGTALVVSALYI